MLLPTSLVASSSSHFARQQSPHAWPLARLHHATLLALAALSAAAQAQTVTAAAAPNQAGTAAAGAPAQVVITGNPLGGDPAQAASVLTGDKLTLRLAPTLGETLDGLPGVSSSWYGPNSNRPTIRGLDGDRVRLLDNAGASVDASNLSFDHAVALDPLVVERVEVLRGPASLLYGGNATGGVVNTIDNRIPTTALDGLGGRVELRAGGAASEKSASGLLEGGQGGFNWHLDGFKRKTEDLRVPRFTPVEDGEAGEPSTRVRNSAAETEGGAIGASYADAAGYLGASLDTYRNVYGVTVEPDVTIHMKRDRFSLAGAHELDALGFEQLSFRYGHTDYRHQEVEGTGEVGTTFDSSGNDLRLEARHRGLFGNGAQGVIGLQAETLDFSALGEEAFVPNTRSRNAALFALEEVNAVGGKLSLGLRAERAAVHSEGDQPDAEGQLGKRFGAATNRDFTPLSASVSGTWPLASQWSVSASFGSTQRAPAYYELFANGLHVATASYERGNADLGLERSTHADLGLNWAQGADSASLQLFGMRFANFISLEASGRQVDEAGEPGGDSPEYVFRGVRAQLWGLELEGHTRFARLGGWQLDLSSGLDMTRGENRDTGEALPRIAPLRVTLGLDASQGNWQLGAQVRHAVEQNRVPASDVRTPGYTLLSLSASYKQAWGANTDALWFLKLDNLGNTLAYSASSIQTMRELAPLPGRSASAGVRLRF
ncbi:TonB-dependent receptor [Ideonella azotifigens]|uniref:TonB-dependent receptor n=2 Tax=Ideonella azotifigens TaxID=513160 RepID=A0ABN1K6H8_9BURK|nr:TonB-dependent receptor [Ideonella azotifigens]